MGWRKLRIVPWLFCFIFFFASFFALFLFRNSRWQDDCGKIEVKAWEDTEGNIKKLGHYRQTYMKYAMDQSKTDWEIFKPTSGTNKKEFFRGLNVRIGEQNTVKQNTKATSIRMDPKNNLRSRFVANVSSALLLQVLIQF